MRLLVPLSVLVCVLNVGISGFCAMRVHDASETECLMCHDGIEKNHEHKVTVKADKTHPPEEWPLEKGSVSCVTCHAVLEKDESAYKSDPSTLRGGPYGASSDFCARCHRPAPGGGAGSTSEASQEDVFNMNPHEAMVKSDGRIDFRSCSQCHSVAVRSPKTPITPKDLKGPSLDICLMCHSKNQHSGTLVHVGKELSATKRVAWKKSNSVSGIRVPLSEDKFVGCVSCHNPHPEQVLKTFGRKIPGELVQKRSKLSQELRSFRDDMIKERFSKQKITLKKGPTLKRLPLRMTPLKLCKACHP